MSDAPAVLVEACVAGVASARTAEASGAGRVELCSGLVEGGITPSLGLMARVRERVEIPVHVLIRPRGGDFLYDGDELEVMLRDIAAVKAAGCEGVVLGALDPAGAVDREVTARLADAARPLSVTFHRAFDLARDPAEALEVLLELGIDRLLTSGQAPTARQGAACIAGLVRRAAGRLVIMAGGGIDQAAAAELVAETGVRELHVGGGGAVPSAMVFRREGVPMGKSYRPDEYVRVETDAERLAGIVRSVRVRP
jgi:copper homeostasis protein